MRGAARGRPRELPNPFHPTLRIERRCLPA
jgi:hypothetical protein